MRWLIIPVCAAAGVLLWLLLTQQQGASGRPPSEPPDSAGAAGGDAESSAVLHLRARILASGEPSFVLVRGTEEFRTSESNPALLVELAERALAASPSEPVALAIGAVPGSAWATSGWLCGGLRTWAQGAVTTELVVITEGDRVLGRVRWESRTAPLKESMLLSVGVIESRTAEGGVEYPVHIRTGEASDRLRRTLFDLDHVTELAEALRGGLFADAGPDDQRGIELKVRSSMSTPTTYEEVVALLLALQQLGRLEGLVVLHT